MRPAIAVASAMLLVACAGASDSDWNTPFADRDWVNEVSRSCAPIAPTVEQLRRDGSVSPQDVASVAAALRIALANPVKGQRCAVEDATPPSMRPADDVPYVPFPVA